MQFLRIVLGYALASMAAVVTLLILPAVFLGEPLDPPTSISEFLEATVTFAAFSGIIGAVMLIPSLIFVTVTWEKQGPSLVACLLFGGFGGASGFLVYRCLAAPSGIVRNSCIASTITMMALIDTMTMFDPIWLVEKGLRGLSPNY